MLKERIQEIFEFAKSESPYRKANKGWINKDIFLDLSPSTASLKQKNEAAKITLFWAPINSLLSNIFFILILSSILVFTSLSFVNGIFNFNLLNNHLTSEIVKFEDNQFLSKIPLEVLDSTNLENEQNLDLNDLDEINNMSELDINQINSDQKIITNNTEKEDILIKETQRNKDIEISKNKKSKSNFI